MYFWSYDKMLMPYDQLREMQQRQICTAFWFTSSFWTQTNGVLVFAPCSFDLNIFSSFELCQLKHGSCLVYILEISECRISRIAQHVEFIFRVSTKNTIIKNGQDLKKAYETSPESVAMSL
jgi:hypothetical protein